MPASRRPAKIDDTTRSKIWTACVFFFARECPRAVLPGPHCSRAWERASIVVLVFFFLVRSGRTRGGHRLPDAAPRSRSTRWLRISRTALGGRGHSRQLPSAPGREQTDMSVFARPMQAATTTLGLHALIDRKSRKKFGPVVLSLLRRVLAGSPRYVALDGGSKL